MSLDPQAVFVYGSLLAGGSNHGVYIAGRYDRVQPARLRDYRRVIGWHGWYVVKPCLGEVVAGELYHFPPAAFADALQRLDDLEELTPGTTCGAWYERVVASVETESGVVEAWVYVAAPRSNPPESTA